MVRTALSLQTDITYGSISMKDNIDQRQPEPTSRIIDLLNWIRTNQSRLNRLDNFQIILHFSGPSITVEWRTKEKIAS